MSEPIVVLDRTTSATGSLVETYIPVEDYENLDVLDSFLSDMYDNQDFKVTTDGEKYAVYAKDPNDLAEVEQHIKEGKHLRVSRPHCDDAGEQIIHTPE
ncbi:hypothetical protein SMACR_04708 [Sordaria macrospora]|uniref:WGS project CABT00000000 data, contig 2.21 n=2 Tax=Sordaria macrospora TaxID=5147 RepID=F7W275_SORMK|nr:uncharacterized protein SMAC_04708 [Sordaria macrospora k-hell]KAA8632289.1 hypothetical protein SMACR_04708 [Sordaria macrospora]WPJ61980.1 hypothetical protein SMAC4_04708 [Sordaria macrospora]CCC11725.1 unnamed protein product [Sordaria macrospora k-hell]